MIVLDPMATARAAVAAQPARPVTSVLLDSPDARLVVFRIAPGQAVPPHRSEATVMLYVLDGTGIISGGDSGRACTTGELVMFQPGEMHGMRALTETFHLLAVITPRPGTRSGVQAASLQAG